MTIKKLKLAQDGELLPSEVDEILTTEFVEQVQFDETHDRYVLILDTGRAVAFSCRNKTVAHLYEVVE